MPDSSLTKSKQNSISTALVVGGAGFVGSYVCESLLAQNLQVIALDDLSSGQETFIESLKKDKNFKFIKADIDQTPLPDLSNVKYIFHIGGIESYINGIDLSLKTMLVNSIGTYNILELTRQNNAKLLLASSLDIYGGVLSSLSMNNYFGQSERDSKKYTHHEAKRYAEALVTEYYRKYELDARIIRVADVYGPRMDLNSGTEIAQLFQEAITTDGLTIHGDGLKVLHPTFVTDVVAGITKAMFTENTKGKIYNITSHDEINVLNFAYTVQKNSTKPLKIQFTQEYKEIKFPLHPAEIQQTESELAWNAKTKLPEGVTQTLEFFFLSQVNKRPKKDGQVPSIEKTPEVKSQAKIKENTLLLENMKSKEIKPLPHSPELEQSTKVKNKLPISTKEPDKEIKKVNKWNALILATSLFIVLYLFIFPLFALYTTNDKSISSTYDALSQESLESATNAQKNIYFGNVQYDNLEWFFNTIQKRSSFENTRTSLQALDNLNTAIATQSKLKKDSLSLVDNLLNGKSSTSKVEKVKQQITVNFLNIQNAEIENETANNMLKSADNEMLFSKETTDKLHEIIKKSSPLLSKYEKESSVIQNVIQFFSPPQNKAYMLIFQDTLFPNKTDGKVLGYTYVQLNSTGISKMSIQQYKYKDEKAGISDAIKDILEINKDKGWLPLNAIFSADTTTLKNLVSAEGSITVSNLAQIISANDIEDKLVENRADNDFQYILWEEGLKNILQSQNDKLDKTSNALYSSMLNEDVKIITQDAKGVLSLSPCDTDRILQRDFIDTNDALYPNKTNGNPYCISLQEKQFSLQKNKDSQKAVEVTVDPVDTNTNHFKMIYSIKNNSKTTLSEDVEITLPGAPQLTNLQLSFPLSLDKARPSKKDNAVSYTINVTIDPSSQKDLIVEWNSKNSEGDIKKAGIYISKPFGGVIETIYAKLNLDKPSSKSTENTDLFLH